jgi:dynamin-binding protein
MKKRKKRRLDYEKYLVLKAGNKKVDEKLAELVEQYEALNETLKFELPKLSALTEQIGRMCLIRFVSIQVEWYGIWQQKVKTVLEESQMPRDIADIIDKFHRDYKYQQARIQELGIANGAFLQDSPKGRNSQSTTATRDDSSSTKSRTIPPPLNNRPRVHSISSDHMPSLPTPDFARRLSEQFTLSPLLSAGPGLPSFTTRDFPPTNGYSRPGSGSPAVPDFPMNSRPHSTRPDTSRSFDSGGPARRSVESGEPSKSPSSSAYYSASQHMDSLPASARPFSGLFHSAMPVSDEYEESQRSSRASSRERERSGGYNVLYLAASLFEFNISTTKSEAGYPYLTYQAGEVSLLL